MVLYIGTHCNITNFDNCTSLFAKIPVQTSPFHQIFVAGPRSYKINYSDDQLIALNAELDTSGIRCVAHATYLSNPWKGASRTIGHVRAQLKACDKGGLEGLVIHLDNNANNEEAFTNTISAISQDRGDANIIIEINASKNKTLDSPAFSSRESSWRDPHKLSEAIAVAKEESKSRDISLCIDTAHLFSSGISFEEDDTVEEWFDNFTVPYEDIMFHLNDSVGNFGTGKDIHGILGVDKIWGNGDLSGLHYLMKMAYEYEIPMVLERDLKKVPQDVETLAGLFHT